ncbi:1,6-anhydro-N-acetylmuramyl-L-alanine amidase AmpD [Pararobbsia silviterrae]|uniref:1,6-anhydro-N-acetylmuramyl-L-alanine amidase AmpD n=1 Tax=Pararobbsia silviterrae TaxID=1792498 RepID=A0A494XLW8_9BURK|nr:1,6-anhydro-N-acetylmuramyl-L-alanine amidase AmpD [Pararobbsia silviterrae]RKP48543.1 1,6-anhydro-N-acetylmuramyl-L-alanine amidase AmpD [Pararobbsia silviterrae]
MTSSIDDAGWYAHAIREPSPNFDARPSGVAPSVLVLHNISLPPGHFSGQAVIEFFQNRLDWDAHPFYTQIRGVRVSSHFLIRRDGAVIQFVSCDDRAWHAGVSSFFGRERCNDFSIGIELEGSDECPFDDAQYAPLANLASALIERYALTALAGHSDIAPGRKTDPGPMFDWPRVRRMLGLSAEYFPYLAADQSDAG